VTGGGNPSSVIRSVVRAKSENIGALIGFPDIAGLEIMMNDPLLMRVLERFSNLNRIVQSLRQR